jgi:hypothetical protein
MVLYAIPFVGGVVLMLTACRSHEDYQLFLKMQLTPLYQADTNRLLSFSQSSAAL